MGRELRRGWTKGSSIRRSKVKPLVVAYCPRVREYEMGLDRFYLHRLRHNMDSLKFMRLQLYSKCDISASASFSISRNASGTKNNSW